MAILDLISHVHLALLLIMPVKYFKCPNSTIVFIYHDSCWDICF